MSELRERVIRAYGGRQRWQSVSGVMSSMWMGGSAFVGHLHPRPLREVEVSVDLQAFRIQFSPFPSDGEHGVFEINRVAIRGDDGTLRASRSAPAAVIRSPRHWLIWDQLDLLYVAGVVVWQTILVPWLLTRSGLGDEALPPRPGDADRLDRLEVHFPADLPLPAQCQTLYIDSPGMVRRLEYWPAAWGGWVRVVQVPSRQRAADRLVIAAEQSFYPCLPTGQALRSHRLLWLCLDDFSVDYAASAAPGAATSVDNFGENREASDS